MVRYAHRLVYIDILLSIESLCEPSWTVAGLELATLHLWGKGHGNTSGHYCGINVHSYVVVDTTDCGGVVSIHDWGGTKAFGLPS